MKYTIAIEELEYVLLECKNTMDNTFDGDFWITDQEKKEAKETYINVSCAIEVLKNNEE